MLLPDRSWIDQKVRKNMILKPLDFVSKMIFDWPRAPLISPDAPTDHNKRQANKDSDLFPTNIWKSARVVFAVAPSSFFPQKMMCCFSKSKAKQHGKHETDQIRAPRNNKDPIHQILFNFRWQFKYETTRGWKICKHLWILLMIYKYLWMHHG